MEKPFLIFLMVMMLAGCSRPMSCDRLMDRADSLTAAGDDSSVWAAKALLDSGGSRAATLPTAQRMRYRLLYARVMNKACIPFTTDSVVKAVAGWYALHGTPNERMEAWYLLGCAYRDLGDAPRAIVALNKAEACADTLARDCDYKTLSRICGQKSSLYHQQMMARKSLAEIDKGVGYALKGKDTLTAVTLYNHKFSDYEQLNNIDSAVIVNEHSAGILYEMNQPAAAAMALGANISCYIQKGRLSDARKAIDAYEQKSGLFKGEDIEEGREVYYNVKASYFLAVGQTDSAEFFCRKEMDNGTDLNNQQAAAFVLAELYKKIGRNDSAAKYALLAAVLKDSIVESRQDREIQRLNSIYSYKAKQKDLDEKNDENGKLKTALAFFALVFLVGVLFYCKGRLNAREKMAKLHGDYLKAMAELKDCEEVLREARRRVDNPIVDENMQASLRQKEERIQLLQGKIREYEDQLGLGRDLHVESDLRSAPVCVRFEQLCKKGELPTLWDWKKLIATLEGKVPKFRESIIGRRKITEKEYRLCVLVRYGFRPKEINTLLGGECSNMTMTRIRLLKKIFGVKGTARDFDRMIGSIK